MPGIIMSLSRDPEQLDELYQQAGIVGREPDEEQEPMSLQASAKARNTFTVPSGTHVGRCYQIVDVGTQHTTFNGKPRLAHKVRVSFELPVLRVKYEDGSDKPAAVHVTYTLSLSEKANLRKHLESWRGRAFTAEELSAFNIGKVLGAPALVSVTHTPRKEGTGVYVNIAGLSKVITGMAVPTAENKPVLYEIEHGRNDVFQTFPEWLQAEIEGCVEWNKKPEHDPNEEGSPVPQGEPESFDDSVPF